LPVQQLNVFAVFSSVLLFKVTVCYADILRLFWWDEFGYCIVVFIYLGGGMEI